MWTTTTALVLLLLTVDLQVNGAVGKTRGSEAEHPKPEEMEMMDKSKGIHNTPASETTSSSDFKGKLLVIPMDGSHWIDLKAVAQEMGRRGHRVTVVIPEISMQMGPGKHFDTVFFPVPYEMSQIKSLLEKNKDLLRKSESSFYETVSKRLEQIQEIKAFIETTAESLLFNTSVISHLAQQDFDAVLTDPMVPTGALIARKLGLPFVNLLRGIPCSLDMKSAGCPSPPSYVPRFFTGYTDKMTFRERTINTLVGLVEPLMCKLLFWQFDHIAYQFLGEEVGIAEVLTESDIWLLRIDTVFEFPRPLMPNTILVGGLNCHVRNPLPDDLSEWVSGDHGFIVFTLGSAISDMPEEITSTFLETFRQIPQKIIWRYTGKLPVDVPENVKIMEWVPQNDLLAHPGVRAFITHAGSHGLYEGICHAVPMVMVPVGGDQPDNAQKMASRGVGIILDLTSITTEILLQGLNDVINSTRYKENMQRLSALHKDRPVDPLNLSVFWTEFVMRHKGAKHLRAAVHDLNWIQYHSLDVMALLATVLLVFVMLTFKCFRLCCGKLGRKTKQD